jgi:hypothetical protein
MSRNMSDFKTPTPAEEARRLTEVAKGALNAQISERVRLVHEEILKGIRERALLGHEDISFVCPDDDLLIKESFRGLLKVRKLLIEDGFEIYQPTSFSLRVKW